MTVMDVVAPKVELAREPAFNLGGLRVSPCRCQVSAGAEREKLQPRVMQVLVHLARFRGKVVSRDDLIVTCWGGQVVSDDAINRCIARLRRLAEAHGGFDLQTIPKIGYQLTEDVPSGAVGRSAGPLGVLWRLRSRLFQ